jgi:hypothetical protein
MESNNDGIPDLWRETYFQTTSTNSRSCASCDPDGSGFSNLQAFNAGINPTNPSTAFRITAVQDAVSGAIISFPSIAGKIYRVDMRNDMVLSPWTLLVDQIVGTGSTIQITDPTAIGPSKRFYRVDILP